MKQNRTIGAYRPSISDSPQLQPHSDPLSSTAPTLIPPQLPWTPECASNMLGVLGARTLLLLFPLPGILPGDTAASSTSSVCGWLSTYQPDHPWLHQIKAITIFTAPTDTHCFLSPTLPYTFLYSISCCRQ